MGGPVQGEMPKTVTALAKVPSSPARDRKGVGVTGPEPRSAEHHLCRGKWCVASGVGVGRDLGWLGGSIGHHRVMSFKSFVESLVPLTGEHLEIEDSEEGLSVRFEFDKFDQISELVATHSMFVEPLNRYACLVADRANSEEHIEVSFSPDPSHVATVYANALFALEQAIAKTTGQHGVHLEDLLHQGERTDQQMHTKAVIFLTHITPRAILEGELGSKPKSNGAFADILATLLEDAGVGSHVTGYGMDSFHTSKVMRVLDKVGLMTTARLLLATPQ